MKSCLILLCFLLVSCVSEPSNPEGWMARERNACLPTAITMVEGLKRQGIQARVVSYAYNNAKGKSVGHGIAAYLYPPGANQLWTYDYEGSWRTRAYWDSPTSIARAAEVLRGREGRINFAEFLTNNNH